MSDALNELWDSAIAKCCQEPIHTPGTIQSFGALIVTDLALDIITHVSANLTQMLGIDMSSQTLDDTEADKSVEQSAIDEGKASIHSQHWGSTEEILGRSLNTVLPPELTHELANVCGLPWISTQREQIGVYGINGQSFHICVHVQGNRTLIEIEPLQDTVERSQTLVSRIKALLQSDRDMQMVLTHCAEELRNATGFDRIMVYQFLEDGAGEVIAEARSNEIESFLHLRFPATDIPDSARQIFRKIAVRPIPDLNTPLVPLIAWNKTEAPLDLSRVSLRGATVVHTQEYLPNMGIASSMALAITIEGKLWGLFAFHHRQPKLLSPQFRSVVELSGLLISLYIQQKLTEADFRCQQDASRLLSQMFAQQVKADGDWQALIVNAMPQICDLLSSNGLAFIMNGQVLATHGDVPEPLILLTLIEQTDAQGDKYGWAIDSLPKLKHSHKIPNVDWQRIAGALFLPIEFNGSHYLVFFRNERICEVIWAGNPNEQQLVQRKNITGVQMRPQRSFNAYKQLVSGYCRPWSRQDRALVQELGNALENQVFSQERQSLLIAELKHRVKNILALINSVAHQTRRSSQSIDQYVQVLERRISSLAMAHELVTRRELSWPRLQDLFELELHPYLRSEWEDAKDGAGNSNCSSIQVNLTGPEVVLNSSFVPTFILVIHELVSNAVKYGALSVPEGQLTIQWFKDRGGLTLLWREANGPRVAPPDMDRRGFGSELIKRAIPYEFDGEANLCFAPSGLEVNFWLPQKLVRWELRNLSSTDAAQSKLDKPEDQGNVVSSQTLANVDQGEVLLVEDNMLIAIEMETLLRKFGFSTVDSVPTVDRAMKLLHRDKKTYRFCLLDINLKTETSFAIAYHLIQTKTRLAFVSGYSSKHSIPDDLRDISLLKKPVDFSKLVAMLQTVLAEA
ncbi:MAG: HWE histidine kinase domain-containing protein [Cyanobacteria bacterium P01_F01_bin.150]